MPPRHVFLEGPRIYLRALEEKDLAGGYFQWLNDAEVCEHNSHATFPNSEQKQRRYLEYAQTASDAVVLAVVTRDRDRHIGNVSLQRINWLDRTAELAILIGERGYWRSGLSTEACRLLVEYGFVRLNLNRIGCGTSERNVGMQKLALRLGMRQEGLRRKAMYKNGEYLDIVEFGVLREEYLGVRGVAG